MANRYRYTWKNDANGWDYRLDVLPYDATLADAITTLDAGTVVEVDTLELAFDELPIGLMDAPTMAVTFNFSRLPSALQTRLRQKVNGLDRNVFLFFTDRGTSGGTYSLEFCGTQADVESADYELINKEDIAAEEYLATYELIDCLHHAMASNSGRTVFDGSLWAAGDGTLINTYIFDMLMLSGGFYVRQSLYDVIPVYGVSHAQVSSWAHCMARLRSSMSSTLNESYVRTTNATILNDDETADLTYEWDTLVTTGALYYAPNTTLPRDKSTQLDEDTAYLVTHVWDYGGELVGGLWSRHDEYGWAQATSIVDLMRDFCETFGVKASYTPTYNTSGSGDYVSYTWNIAAPADYSDAFTSGASVATTKALSIGTISEAGSTIAKAEVRWELYSSKYNYDVTEYVAIDDRSRSSRSWNTEPILHNVPSYKPKRTNGVTGAKESGLFQTNRILCKIGSYFVKAHEETTYNISANLGVAYDTAFNEAFPSPLAGENNDPVADDPVSNALLTAWLNEAQRNASTAGLAEAVLQMFGQQFQATVEITYPLSYSANVQPHRFGTKHNLSGGPVDVFTHLGWSSAVIVSESVDWTEGTNTITYLLMDV